jgi:hypothetical protein
VQELLEVFAPLGVSELLDYTTLRLESGNYVTPAMKPRSDDVVWSVEPRLQGVQQGMHVGKLAALRRVLVRSWRFTRWRRMRAAPQLNTTLDKRLR